MNTLHRNRALEPLRRLGWLLAACVLFCTVSLQAQDPDDMSVAAFEAAKKEAAVQAMRQAEKVHQFDIELLEAVKDRIRIGDPVTVTLRTTNRPVTGKLYGITGSGERLYAKIADRKIGIDDMYPADAIRIKHANMKVKEVDAEIARMEEDVRNKLEKTSNVKVDTLIERKGYTRAFMKNTMVVNGRFYYISSMGDGWFPIHLQRLPKEQDPFGRYASIYFPSNKLKVPGQVVILIDGKAVGTRRDVLDDGGWGNLRVTIPRALLASPPEAGAAEPAESEDAGPKAPPSDEEIQANLLKRMTVRVYLKNAGHWDLRPIGYEQKGEADVAVCALMFKRDTLVDAKGRVEKEVAEFADHVATAKALETEVADAMAKAVAEFGALREDEIIRQQQLEEEKERKAKERKAVQEIIDDINLRTSSWFSANNPPQDHVLTDQQLVNANLVRGPAEFPFSIDNLNIKRISPWYHENDVRFRDLKKRNFQYVGMKYRFLQIDTGKDEAPEFLLQSALFFDNRAVNNPVNVAPKLTFEIKQVDDAAELVKNQPSTVTIRYQYAVQPSWSGYLVGSARISIFQLYRRVGEIKFEPEPKEELPKVPEAAGAAEGEEGDEAVVVDGTADDAG